ncbi:cellulase family glycosylhydrolase [Mesorhizobium sp. Cs1299R1N1]|uniref:glycoside hydrolase family 5 protein n=1 Tax=Mesorhizobium sp. Cs1299R1N1 TaxID=3015172 RepID=UPI00301C2298
MEFSRRQLLSASIAALTALSVRAAAAPKTNSRFQHGGSIHTMMNWGALRDGDPQHYLARPFETARNVFPAELVRDFAQVGFDFIRLSLDVGPFIQLQGSDRDALERKLMDNLQLFQELGLSVIVDCHPVEQVPAYSVQSILADLEAPLFAQYTAMISRLAALLGELRSERVALELMNEPVVGEASHRTQVQVWGAAQLVLHDAARRAAVDLPILLTGADYGGISGLTDLDPSPFIDSNTLFSYHYYMPLSFTHQGIDFGTPDAPSSPYVVDLPYPYDAVSPDEISAKIEARIAANTALDQAAKTAAMADARRILDGFLADGWNRARVEKDFVRVANWADRNGIARNRIVMGECGVTRRDRIFTGAEPTYRRAWLSDVTGIAKTQGFGWALWEINGRQFGIQRADDNRIDPSIVEALGMSG